MIFLTQLVSYIAILALAALILGPGMTGLMLKALSHGYWAGTLMLAGLVTADLIYLLISIYAVGYISSISPYFSQVLVILSSLYLMYLSYQYWTFQGNLVQDLEVERKIGYLGAYGHGLLITLSNPKTMTFYLALVPNIFNTQSLQSHFPILMLCTAVTLSFIGGLYIAFSMLMKNAFKSLRLQKYLLKILALIMGSLALSMLIRQVMS